MIPSMPMSHLVIHLSQEDVKQALVATGVELILNEKKHGIYQMLGRRRINF